MDAPKDLRGTETPSSDDRGDMVERSFATPAQIDLLRALARLHPRLSQTYEGALRAYADERNPECLPHCAHSIRELFDALPLAVTPVTKGKPADLKAKVRETADMWAAAMGKTAVLSGAKWSGIVDSHLSKMLTRLTAFFKWFEEEHPRHTAERDMALDHFDPGHRRLPPQLRKQRGQAVSKVQRYMNSVAHHNVDPPRTEFAVELAEAETVIRMFVSPAPYADRKEIDDILKGDES